MRWVNGHAAQLNASQGCRGYGDSHGYGFRLGMGTVMNPMGLSEFCGDFLMEVRLSETRQIWLW